MPLGGLDALVGFVTLGLSGFMMSLFCHKIDNMDKPRFKSQKVKLDKGKGFVVPAKQ